MPMFLKEMYVAVSSNSLTIFTISRVILNLILDVIITTPFKTIIDRIGMVTSKYYGYKPYLRSIIYFIWKHPTNTVLFLLM